MIFENMMADTVLKLENVDKHYVLDKRNVVKAVNGVNLKIKRGEFVTIFGPSGCGKSTLMHLIGLLDKPTNGKVFINGKDSSKMTRKEVTRLRRETIGFVFQSFFLIQRYNAFENIELPLLLSKQEEAERNKRTRELLGSVGLEDRKNHLPNQLSGGQKQRVAIARALVNNPSIILADEPTGNLDSKTGDEIIDLFKKLWKDGNTVVIITHDSSLAEIAPRKIEMLDGKVIRDEKSN
jgi:putative ABC transport system ATP-binding protein